MERKYHSVYIRCFYKFENLYSFCHKYLSSILFLQNQIKNESVSFEDTELYCYETKTITLSISGCIGWFLIALTSLLTGCKGRKVTIGISVLPVGKTTTGKGLISTSYVTGIYSLDGYLSNGRRRFAVR